MILQKFDGYDLGEDQQEFEEYLLEEFRKADKARIHRERVAYLEAEYGVEDDFISDCRRDYERV